MDQDDPDDFFHFVSDGTIRVKNGLAQNKVKRAEETLRIFNLDQKHGQLRARRKEAVRPFLETALALLELSEEEDCDPRKLCEFYCEVLSEARGTEFYTAIRHSLLPEPLHKSIK